MAFRAKYKLNCVKIRTIISSVDGENKKHSKKRLKKERDTMEKIKNIFKVFRGVVIIKNGGKIVSDYSDNQLKIENWLNEKCSEFWYDGKAISDHYIEFKRV